MGTIPAALRRAIFDVFERMFFLFPEEVPPGSVSIGMACCSVRLDGDPVYDVTLCYERPLGRVLAANFLGLNEPETSAEMVDETVKEAVNVIAGSLLNELASGHRLGIPSFRQPSPETAAVRLEFSAEGHLFAVLVSPGR